jgi:hypothetical protein
VTQLRTFVYRSAAPKLVNARNIIRLAESQQWNQNKLREEANAYTEMVCTTCRCGEGVRSHEIGQGPHWGGGFTCAQGAVVQDPRAGGG